MKINGPTMGTRYNITVMGLHNQPKLQKAVNQELSRVTKVMSTYDPESELMQLNTKPIGQWQTVSKDLYAVLEKALAIHQLSDQSYDVTIGPLVNVWGFGPDSDSTVPSDIDITKAQSLVGSEHIQLNAKHSKVMKTADVFIDLSSIAKGYGVDQIAKLLLKQGATGFLVEIGGEVRTYGKNDRQQLWRIGIEKPSLAQTGAQLVVQLNNQSMATSGDYRNYFEVKNQPYSHIISPKTGRPVTHTLASATVILPLSMDSDALATAFLVLGKKRSLEIANKHDIPLYLISYNDQVFSVSYSKAFEPFLPTGANQ